MLAISITSGSEHEKESVRVRRGDFGALLEATDYGDVRRLSAVASAASTVLLVGFLICMLFSGYAKRAKHQILSGFSEYKWYFFLQLSLDLFAVPSLVFFA